MVPVWMFGGNILTRTRPPATENTRPSWYVMLSVAGFIGFDDIDSNDLAL
jgi:hypothetical protein